MAAFDPYGASQTATSGMFTISTGTFTNLDGWGRQHREPLGIGVAEAGLLALGADGELCQATDLLSPHPWLIPPVDGILPPMKNLVSEMEALLEGKQGSADTALAGAVEKLMLLSGIIADHAEVLKKKQREPETAVGQLKYLLKTSVPGIERDLMNVLKLDPSSGDWGDE